MKKQNQHELPKLYLEAFCDPNEGSHVWVFTRSEPYEPSRKRGKGNPFLSGVERTASAVNRYAGRTSDGTFHVDRWERQLQRTENAADNALCRVRAKLPIIDGDKEALTEYLLAMWRRVRKRWEAAESRAEAHVAGFDFDAIARELAFGGMISAARQIYDAQKFLASAAGRKNLALDSMVQEMTLCRGALLDMTWNFVGPATEMLFFTNDAPFMFAEALGLQASHVLFPVSPDVMLIAGHGDPKGAPYERVSAAATLTLNSLTWALAHREVYAPSKAKWIYDMWRYGVTFDQSGAYINQPTA